jgi:hypothetical protein
MKQQAAANSFADDPQTTLMARARSKIKLARILDRKNMPARDRRRRALAPTRDKALHSYFRMTEQPAESDFDRPVALRQPTQATRAAMHHPFEQQRPPLSRRASPNRPRTAAMSHSQIERAQT